MKSNTVADEASKTGTAVNLCTLVFATLMLASCQNEYVRNPFWDGHGASPSVAPGYKYGHGYAAPIPYPRTIAYGQRTQVPTTTRYVPVYKYPPVSLPMNVVTTSTAKVTKPSPTKRTTVSRTSTSGASSQPAAPIWKVPSNIDHPYPPIPTREGYHARWDTRPTPYSRDGIYRVVNRSGVTWNMKPDEFWPFWSREVYAGRYIRVFENYPLGSTGRR